MNVDLVRVIEIAIESCQDDLLAPRVLNGNYSSPREFSLSLKEVLGNFQLKRPRAGSSMTLSVSPAYCIPSRDNFAHLESRSSMLAVRDVE